VQAGQGGTKGGRGCTRHCTRATELGGDYIRSTQCMGQGRTADRRGKQTRRKGARAAHKVASQFSGSSPCTMVSSQRGSLHCSHGSLHPLTWFIPAAHSLHLMRQAVQQRPTPHHKSVRSGVQSAVHGWSPAALPIVVASKLRADIYRRPPKADICFDGGLATPGQQQAVGRGCRTRLQQQTEAGQRLSP
jgi:hypothetical protein